VAGTFAAREYKISAESEITVFSEKKPTLVTYRGGVHENSHIAHVAVADSQGKLLFTSGDPERITLARSTAKPFQAAAILRTGAVQHFGLGRQHLALMCASHSSESVHIRCARQILEKISTGERCLACGGHSPLSPEISRQWIKTDFTPTGICNNCSGKHAGMIAGALMLTGSAEGYSHPDHPMQQLVQETVSAISGLPQKSVLWATDGCNLPAPAFPLRTLASSYARLAVGTAASWPHAALLNVLYEAMADYPELIGGRGRFCTVLGNVFNGALVGKLGADACYAVAVKASAQTRKLGTSGALGIAVKIEDGSVDALYSVVCELLKTLGLSDEKTTAALKPFHFPEMRNTAGEVTGHRTFEF